MLTGSTATRMRGARRDTPATAWAAILFVTALMAPIASGANSSLVPNGSFEPTLDGWIFEPSVQAGGSAAIAPDTTQTAHGTTSLRMDVVGPATPWVETESIPVESAARYLVSLRYRADGFSSDGSHQGVSSLVGVRWIDGAGGTIEELRLGMPYESESWGHVLRLVTAPATATAVALRIQLSAYSDTLPSSIWIDDVRLRPWVTERVEGVQSWGWEVAARKRHDPHYSVVADEDTASKMSVVANPAYHETGFQLINGGDFGDELAPGAYRVDVRLKVSSNTSFSPLASLRVLSDSAVNYTIASSVITPREFDAAHSYQEISLHFLRPAQGNVSTRLIWEGEAALWIDTLRIVPERLSNASDFSDLFATREIPPAEEPDPPGPPIVTVDPTRFAAPPVPSERLRSARSYLSTSWFFHRSYSVPRLSWLKGENPYPALDSNLQVAFFFAFMHSAAGSWDDALHAKEFVADAHLLRNREIAQSTGAVIHIGRIWTLLEESAALDPLTRQRLIDLLVALVPRFPAERVEYGNSNRPFSRALVGEILLAHVPDAPDAALWREYIETIWSEFWHAKDTRENGGNYNALAFTVLIDWVELRGAKAAFYSDPDIHALFERYMLQVLPIGSLPHYGDTTGWNVEWGHWIHIMEVAAAETGDGRFRWAAQRIHEYADSRIENINSWAYTGSAAIESLMLAHRAANFALAPTAPTGDVVAVHRARIDPLPPETPPNQGLYAVDPTRRVPSKIAMRSNTSKDGTALLMELDTRAGHGPPTSPNLIALVDRGAVLLMDQGYKEPDAHYHNMLWLEDYVGIPLEAAAEEIQILETESTGSLRYAKVRVNRYRGYPAALERSVVLAREGPALIVDRLHFEAAFSARLGQVYNLGVVGPEIGETWVNGYIGDYVPVRGIGANSPLLARWSNPLRDLLIYFAPQNGATLDLYDRRPRDATSTLPLRVRYTHRVDVEAGSELAFASLLVPHAPISHPSVLARKVHFEEHTEESTAVRTGRLENGSRVWLSAGPVNSPTLRTDADAAVAVEVDGEIVSGGLAGGSYLRLSGSNAQLMADGSLATVVRRINAGAFGYADSMGDSWWPDVRHFRGVAIRSSQPVVGTLDPHLYETQSRAAPDDDALRFALPVENGEYLVRLHFAAIDGDSGLCVFDVVMEGELLRTDLDVAAEAGPYTAWTTDFDVAVIDRTLDVELFRRIGDPKISAIEILLRH